MNLTKKLDFPTPESPMMISLNFVRSHIFVCIMIIQVFALVKFAFAIEFFDIEAAGGLFSPIDYPPCDNKSSL